MIRAVHVDNLTKNIKEMCIEVNHVLSADMKEALDTSVQTEKSPLGRQILCQLQENLEIAGKDRIPICQDTGMAIVFLEVGQEVHFEGGSVEVPSMRASGGLCGGISPQICREGSSDSGKYKGQHPGVIHTSIVPGDQVKITVTPKGFGSENMSKIFMLKPADGIEGVKEAVISAVRDAGPNACPPVVVGVGIGGTFEKCAIMAKHALTREWGVHSDIPYVKEMEEELLTKINKLASAPAVLAERPRHLR